MTEEASKGLKLLGVMRKKMRLRHMSIFTEKNYVLWVKRYILFHKKRHPREMGPPEIVEFLSYLASEKNVAAATQNQAFNAIFFIQTCTGD